MNFDSNGIDEGGSNTEVEDGDNDGDEQETGRGGYLIETANVMYNTVLGLMCMDCGRRPVDHSQIMHLSADEKYLIEKNGYYRQGT